jgi:hypothetical protein
MRTLVYLACFSNPVYAEATRLCIASLRGPGRYRGDIAVLTDGTFPEGAPGVTVHRLPATKDTLEIRNAKLGAARILDAARYDRILWLDSDVIAIDDVAPLFAFFRRGLAAGDERPFNTLRAVSVGGCLSRWERLRHRFRWGINAGVFCVEASLFGRYLDLWHAEIQRYRASLSRWIDQPPLNALIVRRRIEFTPYPRGWIELPLLYELMGTGRRFVQRPETKLLHYCGHPDKREMLRRMAAHA